MKERKYGLDILRIIIGVMVIIIHIQNQNDFMDILPVFSIKYELVWLLEIIVYGAVNIFGILSGFFMYNKKISYKRNLDIWLSVLFYSAFITFFFFIINPSSITNKEVLKMVFPVSSMTWWYFTAYFCLLFFVPYLNRLIMSITKKEHQKLIILIFFLFSLTSVFFFIEIYST